MEKEKNTCKVCGKEIGLTEAFCPHCKFPQIIYPAEISQEVKDYEEKRVDLYKEAINQKSAAPDSPKPIGYLIIMQYGDYQQIFPLYKGKNIFGKNPQYSNGISRNVIELDCEGLKTEHFILETDDKGFVVAKLIEGSWSFGNEGNFLTEKTLSNGDTIILDNLHMIYIEK